MKQYRAFFKTSFYVVLAMGGVACGITNGGNGRGNNLPSMAKAGLVGVWQNESGCMSTPSGPFGIIQHTFRNDKTFSTELKSFSDEKCTQPKNTIKFSGTYETGNASEALKGATDLNLNYDSTFPTGAGTRYTIYQINNGFLKFGLTELGGRDGTSVEKRENKLDDEHRYQ